MMSKPSRRVVFRFDEESMEPIEKLESQGRGPSSLITVPGKSMSSAGAFPARTSATPGAEPVSAENGPDCGRSTSGSFARYDRDTSSWRTWQRSLFEGEDSIAFSETWPRAGMTRSGTAFRREPLAPLIFATDASWWPTPDASCNRPHEGNVRLLRRAILEGNISEEEASAIIGKSPFEAQGKIPPYCPTPRADGRDNCGGNNARRIAKRNGTYIGRKESPPFREWLMGFPPGWTDLPPSETP
jgi:hypothetical protein